jgi:hypothetical protein
VNEYSYRKEFGLSYEEFLKEPWEVYLTNMEIMSIRADIERSYIRKMEREAKR